MGLGLLMGRPDRSSAGRSSRVPFLPGEASGDRHARRLQASLNALTEARERFKALGVALEVKNGVQHWILTREGRRAEWWPSSAKLVFDQHWNAGIHAHDIDQVVRLVKKRWGL